MKNEVQEESQNNEPEAAPVKNPDEPVQTESLNPREAQE